MTINITQEHIDEAIKREKTEDYNPCRECPTALAIGKGAIVGSEDIFYNKKVYPLSYELINFITKFDNKLPVKPTVFELEEF